MTTEQKEAIEYLRNLRPKIYWILPEGKKLEDDECLRKAIETVLNLIQEQEKELQKKDESVNRIINRLNNDIKRIAETKTKNYSDAYRRCRLKAYKTKTREIKEYIEKQYFERKVEDETKFNLRRKNK